MNILSSKQLENSLAENSFPEISKYRVLLASQLLFWFSSLIGTTMNSGIKYIFLAIIYKIAFLIIVFIGIKACYSVNKRIDNTNFIERFTLLFFPISLNFILFFLIIFALIMGIIQAVFVSLGGSPAIIEEFNKILPYFVWPFMLSIFYSLLYRSFIRLEQKIKAIGVGGLIAVDAGVSKSSK